MFSGEKRFYNTKKIYSVFSAAVDRDTPAANITYHIVSAQTGYLAYFSNLNITVDKFTQIDVDAGKIAFVHSGAYDHPFF